MPPKVLTRGGRKKKAKKRRREDGDGAPAVAVAPAVAHPAENGSAAVALRAKYGWQTEYGDHFETSARAYADVAGVLERMCGGSRGGARVWDPYYCDGAAGRRLRALGFSGASNAAADFYATDAYTGVVGRGDAAAGAFDVLATNPPYSGDHKRRCLEFALACERPFALLVPAYVAEKKYFADACAAAGAAPFFLGPPRGSPEYGYDHPHGTGKRVAPFASVWVLDSGRGAAATRCLYDACRAAPCYAAPSAPALSESLAALAAAGVVRSAKRPNAKARKRRRKQGAEGG